MKIIYDFEDLFFTFKIRGVVINFGLRSFFKNAENVSFFSNVFSFLRKKVFIANCLMMSI